MHTQWLEVMLTHGRKGKIAIGEHRDLCAVRRMDRVADHLVDEYLLDIRQILHTEEREFPRRHVTIPLNLFHFIDPLGQRHRLAYESEPKAARSAEAVEPLFISTVRTRLSISGRIKST